MAGNKRLRAVIIAGSVLALIAAVGIGVAFASPSGRPRFVTASAGVGDVTQTYTTSGTVARTNTAAASFAVSGTVSSVKVAVGDAVDAGDVLAVLKKGPLQLAVLDAETSVAEAKATLYAAEHPSSSANGSGSRSGSSGTGSSGSGSDSGSSGSGSSGSGSSGSGAGAGATGVTIDPAVLLKVTNQLTAAVANEQKACAPVFGPAPQPSASPTAPATPSASASPSASVDPSAPVDPSESPEPTPTEPSASAEPTTAPTDKPSESPEPTPTEPSESAEPTTAPTDDSASARRAASIKAQADTIESNDPTPEQLKACGEARAQVQLATAMLQRTVQQLVKPSGRPGGGSGGGSDSSTPKVSDAQVASARAKLLQAEQQLRAAQDDLADAELSAPISGTVGSVDLAPGASASAGSITIVGEGNARVTFELPLKTRALVKNGQDVGVTPAGGSKALAGTLTGISVVETSGTAGDTPTYATIATVSDPDGLLATGAKASVSIPVKTATNVVRVPVSAVTPTGTGTGTVQVVDSARAESATTVNVTTGAVGGGWIEITGGVQAGDLVVLADNTAELPTNSNQRRTTSTTRASASPSAAAPPDATPPSAIPSASPSR